MPVRCEVRDGVGWVILDRPDVNALDSGMLQGIIDSMESLANDDDAAVAVIKGAGDVFSGGADIREMATLGKKDAEAFSKLGQAAMHAVADIPKPVVAAVNGPAMGGGSVLAAFCDLRVAAANATFALSEIDRGLYPGWDAAGRFVKILGLGRAAELYLTGASFDARQALAWGFVNRVTAPGNFAREVDEYVRMLAGKSSHALSCAKQVLQMGDGEDARRLDREFFASCIRSPLAKREMDEFLSHRPGRMPAAGMEVQTNDRLNATGTTGEKDAGTTDEMMDGNDMTVIENIKTRRSVRRYKDESVSQEDITTMLECAALAPSPTNRQPWKFIVVRDRELMRRMVAAVEEECDASLSDERLGSLGTKIDKYRKFFNFFDRAPVVIASLYRPSQFLNAKAAAARGSGEYEAAVEDGFCVPMSVGAAIQNLLLAAHSLGYGACWMTGPLIARSKLKGLLGVQEPWELGAIIPLGRPGERPAPTERKLTSELVEYR